MEDLKRLMFPALAAIILHGFLVSLQLPKHQTLKPALKGNPIKIEINAFPPKTSVPKKVEYKKAKVIPKALSQEKVEQKKIIKPPVVISRQQKKLMIEPELTKKEAVIEKNNSNEMPQKKVIDTLAVKQPTVDVHADTITIEPEDIRPEKKISIAPIQKKAIPIYRQNKQPPYPVMAKRRGYEGEVLLHVLVDSEGKVSELKIKHSSGHKSLDRAALKTVRNWLFTPATEGDRPVVMWVDVPIVFQLK